MDRLRCLILHQPLFSHITSHRKLPLQFMTLSDIAPRLQFWWSLSLTSNPILSGFWSLVASIESIRDKLQLSSRFILLLTQTVLLLSPRRPTVWYSSLNHYNSWISIISVLNVTKAIVATVLVFCFLKKEICHGERLQLTADDRLVDVLHPSRLLQYFP